jgi:16S rRNA U516 pseudouridylate synthase RsuA-like enzyme
VAPQLHRAFFIPLKALPGKPSSQPHFMLSYYIFYKPYQVLSQFSAEGDKQTLAHFFKGLPKDVYP